MDDRHRSENIFKHLGLRFKPIESGAIVLYMT